MILPEHKARIRAHDLTPQPRSRPILSADQLSILDQQLKVICTLNTPASITYYKNKQYLKISGRDIRLLNSKTLEIATSKGCDHILLKDIIEIHPL
ncbi:YolD-like family protein [Halolactibacillus alkaliphilus]